MSDTTQLAVNLAILEKLNLDYNQSREGTWVCVSACAIAPGT